MIDLVDLLQTTGGARTAAFDRRFSSFLYDSVAAVCVGDRARRENDARSPLRRSQERNRDGHDYILDAVARGACGVLCQRPVDPGRPRRHLHRRTRHARRAVLAYAAFALQRPNLTTVGITGSVGKTTTKELITAVLARLAAGRSSTTRAASTAAMDYPSWLVS